MLENFFDTCNLLLLILYLILLDIDYHFGIKCDYHFGIKCDDCAESLNSKIPAIAVVRKLYC